VNGHNVGRAGELFVAAEVNRRGGYAATFSGNMPGIDIFASDASQNHRITVQVKAKGPNSRTWQTSTRHARPDADVPEAEKQDRYWVLVDLSHEHPEYYVMPERWIRNDIHIKHAEYLVRHGGTRPDNASSTHHQIEVARVAQWKGRWSELGILPEPSA